MNSLDEKSGGVDSQGFAATTTAGVLLVLGLARDLIPERAAKEGLEDPGAAREVIKDVVSLK